ncbi:MAG: alkaline phosphatase D family protein [Ignavibacteriales bacterium]|nr:alkaline phosphatase D family protein [Ignavibacteriales bacterium]
MITNERMIKNFIIIFFVIIYGCSSNQNENDFAGMLPQHVSRTWIGSNYWANPMQDWQLNNGRIECIASGGDRNVVILTREIKNENGRFEISTEFGKIKTNQKLDEVGWIGFKIGIQGEFSDFRDSAVRGEGFPVGISTNGRLFIGKIDSSVSPIDFSFERGKLKLIGEIKEDELNLNLQLFDKNDVLISSLANNNYETDWVKGLVALVSHSGSLLQKINGKRNTDYPDWGSKPGTNRKGNMNVWFKNVNLSGSLVENHSGRSFGPLLFSQYTLSNQILKLTVQLPPISNINEEPVQFQIKNNAIWETISEEKIDTLSRTSTFRIENWNAANNIPYRLAYKVKDDSDELKEFYREGIIKKEPLDKKEIVIAGFTGNNDLGFPNNELVDAVKFHNPDVLFFSGDQIYEGVGGYGIQTNSLDKITLDYLRKWYLFGWAYGDLMRDRPTVSIPDDHDVYHGNIWGAGGIATPSGLVGADAQDLGGYKYFPEWVNMVQRTQTSHLPDTYDSLPVAQNIGVYYCNMNYGGVSFAVLEDRKFKSAPKTLLPNAKVYNGWAQNKKFDAKKDGDAKGAKLLGERQLKFLEDWSSDWKNNIWMKVVLSQTIFANVATLPQEFSHSDNIVPKLQIFQPDEYPPDDIPVQDMDSNGWPQTPRNKALEIIRKAFAVHIAGDQHLGSSIQYGIENWNDASFAFCVPAISNVWPRRWFPNYEGKNRKQNMPKYTGEYEDGFGNLITVHAVSNPYFSGKEPSKLYDRATGYGIIKLNRESRDVTFECWPRWVDPSKKDAEQYNGWPVKFNQMDNFNKNAFGYLPEIIVTGMKNPVVQIINQTTNEIIYTIRINGNKFTPKIFEEGIYTIKIGELGTNKIKIIKDVLASKKSRDKLEVKF